MSIYNENVVDTTKQPMFFGEPLSVQRYDNFKYPIFDELTDKQMSFFWRPQEVSLSKDISDYKTLTDDERFIFLENLKYQTLLDSIQGRGPSRVLGKICSLPELEACIEAWTFFETIHSRSYTYIMKNLVPNPSIIFDDILVNEHIKKRAVAITKYYDDFETLLNKYFSGQEVSKYDLYKGLYLLLVVINALEGLRFFVSFVCSFTFAKNKKMEGSAKIISLISNDENCFIDGTEILTSSGFKRFQDVLDTDNIAQYRKDGIIEFVDNYKLVKKPYNGKLVKFSNEKHEFIVTPDHRVVYKMENNEAVLESTAKDFNPSCAKHYIVAGKKEGKNKKITDYERFLIAIQADGTLDDGKRPGTHTGAVPVHFYFSKERKLNRLIELLLRLRFKFTVIPENLEAKNRNPNKSPGWYINVKVPLNYKVYKDFSWVSLEDVDHEWCNEFIEELVNWDGYYENPENYTYYSSTVKLNADIVQAIGCLSGFRTRMRVQTDNRSETYNDVYRVYISKEKNYVCCGTSSKVKKSIDYDGMVYCANVPSGMLVTRYNNEVLISGNCHLAITQNIINKYRKSEQDDLMLQVINESEQDVLDIYTQVVEQEKEWADHLFNGRGMLGLSAEYLHNYIEYLANKRMKAIGIQPIFKDNKVDPFAHLDSFFNPRNLQVAPQETEISSYLTSGVTQDINDETFKDFSLD